MSGRSYKPVIWLTACVLSAATLMAPSAAAAPASPQGVRSTALSPAVGASATAATLEDYWQGKADWAISGFYSKTQYAFDAGDGGYGAGTKIAVGPDGNWYWTYRTNNSPGNDCTEQPLLATSTVVRKSTDRGATWSPSSYVVKASPNTPWSCDATDGDLHWTGTGWVYLFQCRARPADLANGGPFFNVCLFRNSSTDPTAGTWTPNAVNPVMGNGGGRYDPWTDICDAPEDDCVRLGGGPGGVNQIGTPSIFEVPSEPGWFFIDFHGIDQNAPVQRGYQFTGVAKTQDFVTFVAGRGSNLPTDAIFDREDTLAWREPALDWTTTTVGGGGGAVFRDPVGGKYYNVVESSNGGYPSACFDATVMDIGILRADSPAQTTWSQPAALDRQNPIVYSQLQVLSDEIFPNRCYPSYASVFHDPATGETYLSFDRRSSEDDNREGVYVAKLVPNLLKNGDAWRCVDAAPFQLTSPTALSTSLQIWRDGNWATDQGCYFAFTSDIKQDITLAAGRTFSTVDWGGKFAGRLSNPLLPMGFGSLEGSGTIRVDLTQLNALGSVLATDSALVPVVGTYPATPRTTTTTLNPATTALRFTVSLNNTSAILTVLADEMFVRAA